MRIRTLIAGVGIGVMTALTLSAPASALTAPTVTSWDDQCAAKGRSTVTIKVDDGQTVGLRVVNAQGTEVGHVYGVTSETVAITVTDPTGLKVQYRSGGPSVQWGDLPGATHTWSDAACRPNVTVSAPTCDNPYLGVSHANPAGGPADLKIGYNGNVLVGVAPGAYAAFDKSTVDISYTWTINSLGLSETKTIEYAEPTNCGGDTPGAGTVPEVPGEEFHGQGQYEHVIYVVQTGACQGDGCPAKGGKTTGDTLPVTGSSTSVIMMAGGILLAAGAITLFLFRRNSKKIRFQS